MSKNDNQKLQAEEEQNSKLFRDDVDYEQPSEDRPYFYWVGKTKKKTKKEQLGLFDTNTIITCNTSKIISFKVIIDGTEIGRIKDKGHLFLGLPKGTHTILFKSKFDQTDAISFEILDAPIEINFKFVFKKKILVRTLTFEQQLELYRELTRPKKIHKSRMASSDYEPYTDEEMDTYDLLDGD